MNFSDELMISLAGWQKGWRENQDERKLLAQRLLCSVNDLAPQFKTVSSVCYRKRFLHRGELKEMILNDEKKEGVVSWTVEKLFAERFKFYNKEGAVSGAIFEHKPSDSEVVVNICRLWEDPGFIEAAEKFQKRFPEESKPLFCFKGSQGEVVLEAPLRGSEIVALTGKSSVFDGLCEQAGIPEDERDDYFRALIKDDACPDELRYTSKASAQKIIKSIRSRFG